MNRPRLYREILEENQILLVLSCIALITYRLFCENLVFSVPDGAMALRTVDEVSFFSQLANMIGHFKAGNFGHFFSNVQMGYGNSFWSINTALFYPFVHFDSPQWGVVFIRNLSILSYLGTLVNVFNISKVLTRARVIPYCTVLMFAMLPVSWLAAMRFHNHSHLAFLGTLALYFSLKKPTVRSICATGLILGFAGGMKLAGLILLPLCFLLLFVLQKEKGSLKQFGIFGVSFLGSFFVSLSPLLFSPWHFKFTSLFVYEKVTATLGRTMVAGSEQPGIRWSEFLDKVFYPNFEVLMFFTLAGLLLYSLLRKRKEPLLLLICLYSLILPVVFSLVLKRNYQELAFYFYPCFGLVFLTLVALDKSKLRHFLFFVLVAMNIRGWSEKVPVLYTHSEMSRRAEVRKKIETRDDLQKILAGENRPISAFADYRVIFPQNVIEDVNTVHLYFDNFRRRWNNLSYDYLAFHRSGFYFRSLEELARFMKGEKQQYDKKVLDQILERGLFRGKKYKLIYDKNDTVVFRKMAK